MKNELARTFGISPQQVKVFLLAFMGMFIVASLHHLGVQAPWKQMKLTIPVPAQTVETIDTIKPLLEKTPSSFSLKENAGLIPQTYAADELDQAAAYAVVDLDTGEIIRGKNSKDRLPVASITKIMTAVVALDLADPSEVFSVDENAASMIPTKIVIEPGEKLTFEELLNASLMTSANDATQQIRNAIDKKYHDKIFVDAMNHKAAFLNLTNTHFANAMGFDDPENYSSAEDLAKLAQYAITNYPKFEEIVSKDYTVLPANENHKEFKLYNWNGLIGVYPDVHGVKIGNTAAAGKTTLVYATRNGKKMAAIVLGAPDITKRDLWAAQLLDIGYEQTLGLPPVGVTEEQLLAKYSTWQYTN